MTKHDIPYLNRLRDELTRSIEARQERAREGVPARWLRGRRLMVVAGATATVAATVAAVVFLGGGAGTPVGGTSEPPAIAQCVSQATPETLRERDYALDGTILGIEVPADEGLPTRVTVEVERWYKGGEGATAALETYSRPGVITIEGGAVPLVAGTRILASGDDGFLWDCGGYSMEYSENGARLFEEAFGD